MKRKEEQMYEKRVATLSTFTVITIFIIKIITSIFTNSLSFFAELSDSILDFAALGITIFGLRISQKPADAEHMYGHAKVNSLASVFQAILIIGLYVSIIYIGIKNIINYENYTVANPGDGVIALILSLIIVQFVSKYIVSIGVKTNNPLIKAQGLNFKGDLYRNIAIIVGLIIASFGFVIIDVILAIIVSIRAIFDAIGILKQGFSELLDYNAIDPDEILKIRKTIESWDDIEKVDTFNIRTFGNILDAYIALVMKKNITVTRVDNLNAIITKYLKENFPNFNVNVVVQVATTDQKPEDYEQVFERIRRANQKVSEIHNIHNISVDVFKDKILIQFHLDISEDRDLTYAHEKATLLEEQIRKEFPEEYLNKLEIISHIEPAGTPGKIHHHESQIIENNIKTQIDNVIQAISEIKYWDHPVVLEDYGKLSVTLSVYMDGKLSILEVHRITKMVEDKLKEQLPTLYRCIIHSEPYSQVSH